MPTLPAPTPFLPSGGDLAVRDTSDVLAAYPKQVRDSTDAPVRDALVESALEMLLAHQRAADYAAAQSDPTRATGLYLQGHAADRGVFAQDGEGDEELRARVFTVPDVVTPQALLTAINGILALYTDTSAQIFESVLDRWYAGDGTSAFHSFIGDGTVNVGPDYPDRRYALRPGFDPGGAWVFSDHEGRYFVVRVPDLSGITDALAFGYDGTQDPAGGLGFFTDDGTDGDGSAAGFVFAGAQSADSIYQAIINSIEQIRGHGVRWKLLVDPKLTP